MAEIHDLIRRSTDLATASVRDVAERAGLSRETIHDWRQSRRTPRPRNVRALAASLSIQAGKLSAFSDELEKLADEMEGEGGGEQAEEVEDEDQLELAG